MKIEHLKKDEFALNGAGQLLPSHDNMNRLFDKINEIIGIANGPINAGSESVFERAKVYQERLNMSLVAPGSKPINDMNDPETRRAADQLDRFREPEGGW